MLRCFDIPIAVEFTFSSQTSRSSACLQALGLFLPAVPAEADRKAAQWLNCERKGENVALDGFGEVCPHRKGLLLGKVHPQHIPISPYCGQHCVAAALSTVQDPSLQASNPYRHSP